MKDTIRESLSALMDGEASELELRRILKSDDAALRSEWAALNRNQQLMHDGGLPHADLDISSRVMAAIDEEPLRAGGNNWRQALAGVAVAASVAAVVVFTGSDRMMSGAPATLAQQDAVSSTSGRVYPAQLSPANGGVTVSATAGAIPTMAASATVDDQQRFEELLRKHTERASLNNGQGFVSYARVVSQESE